MFDKTSITVYIPDEAILLRRWREPAIAKLWRFSLRPQYQLSIPNNRKSGPVALNALNLPSIVSLVRSLYASAGLPVISN